jgi:hypothetical protein
VRIRQTEDGGAESPSAARADIPTSDTLVIGLPATREQR